MGRSAAAARTFPTKPRFTLRRPPARGRARDGKAGEQIGNTHRTSEVNKLHTSRATNKAKCGGTRLPSGNTTPAEHLGNRTAATFSQKEALLSAREAGGQQLRMLLAARADAANSGFVAAYETNAATIYTRKGRVPLLGKRRNHARNNSSIPLTPKQMHAEFMKTKHPRFASRQRLKINGGEAFFFAKAVARRPASRCY